MRPARGELDFRAVAHRRDEEARRPGDVPLVPERESRSRLPRTIFTEVLANREAALELHVLALVECGRRDRFRVLDIPGDAHRHDEIGVLPDAGPVFMRHDGVGARAALADLSGDERDGKQHQDSDAGDDHRADEQGRLHGRTSWCSRPTRGWALNLSTVRRNHGKVLTFYPLTHTTCFKV